MSGLEVLGIILAFYPLIVDAVVACKDTEFANSAETKLDIEKIVYIHFLSRLLSPHLPRKALKAISKGESFDWDPNVEGSIRDRLGPLKARVMLDTLSEIRKLFDLLQHDIDGINQNEQESKFRANLRRVKHSLPRSNLKKRLLRLTECNQILARVFTDDLLSSATVKSSSGRKSSRAYVRRDSRYEEELHNVICSSYSCQCDSPHLANLELGSFDFESPKSDDSESDPGSKRCQLLFYVRDEKESDTITLESRTESLVGSQQSFAIDQFSQSPPALTPVLSRSEQQGSSSSTPELSNSRRWSNLPTPDLHSQPVRSRVILVSEGKDHDAEQFTDLCDFLRSLGDDAIDSNRNPLLGLLVKNEKKYHFEVATAGEETISLQDWLEKSKLLRKERIEIALILALAVLRLHSTPWIQKRWTYRDFEISQPSLESGDFQLFVSSLFYSTQTQPPTTAGVLDYSLHESILTRLGFALTELGLSKPLYEYHPTNLYFEMNTAQGDIQDFCTAKEILTSGKLMMEQCEEYQNVVNACLNHQFWGENGVKMIDSRRPDFHDNVERCIIMPLYNIWESFGG